MKVIKATFKIACCYEVALHIEELLTGDSFAEKLRTAIAQEVDSGYEELDSQDMTVEISDEDIEVLFDSSEDGDALSGKDKDKNKA